MENYIVEKKLLKAYNKIRNKDKRQFICLAPFSTMLFTQFGEILPCYYNKNIVFGKYPQDDPVDVWFGEKMQKLRENLKSNNMSYGCQDCYNYIKSKNFYSTGAWKYDYLPINKSNFPVSLDFQISNICNLACIMCNGEYSQTVRQWREKKDKYPNPYDKQFVEKIKPFIPHLKNASFTGGEVFLIKLYYDIWDAIADINPNVRISVATNGTILNSRVIKYLEKLDFNISISLHSVNKETFEQIRRFSKFEKVMQNFDYFIDYTRRKNTLLTVKICPMRQNAYEIPDLIRFLNSKDVLFQFNNVIFPSYVALWNLPSNELLKLLNFLKKQKYKTETPTQKENMHRIENLILQITNWYKKALEFEKTHPDIQKKSLEQIYLLLKDSINSFLVANPNISKTNLYGMSYEQIFKDVMEKIDDKELLKNSFLYFFRMPIHRLISELNIRDMEKITQRIIQAGYTEPPEIEY